MGASRMAQSVGEQIRDTPGLMETHWRDVSARFSFMAKAMALPPSSCSRLAAKLEAEDRGHHHTQVGMAPYSRLGAPPGPWNLLKLPQGAVGAQGMGDGGATLLADGVLSQAGETLGLGRSAGGPSAPHSPLVPLQGCSHALQQHLQHHLHLCSLHRLP